MECKSIEEKIKYIKDTDPVELVGEIMGLEAQIIGQNNMIRSLKEEVGRLQINLEPII
jgi:hypothetical protein